MASLDELRIGNYIAKIDYDPEPFNPREFNEFSTMVCFHSKYILGDKHSYSKSNFNSFIELEEDLHNDYNIAAILPVYMYDHSGVAVSTTRFCDRFDSGQIGFIFTTREFLLENHKEITQDLLEEVTEALKKDVDIYNQFLNGDVYAYTVYEVETCNLGHEHEQELDSYGSYSSVDECRFEAAEELRRLVEQEQEQEENWSLTDES